MWKCYDCNRDWWPVLVEHVWRHLRSSGQLRMHPERDTRLKMTGQCPSCVAWCRISPPSIPPSLPVCLLIPTHHSADSSAPWIPIVSLLPFLGACSRGQIAAIKPHDWYSNPSSSSCRPSPHRWPWTCPRWNSWQFECWQQSLGNDGTTCTLSAHRVVGACELVDEAWKCKCGSEWMGHKKSVGVEVVAPYWGCCLGRTESADVRCASILSMMKPEWSKLALHYVRNAARWQPPWFLCFWHSTSRALLEAPLVLNRRTHFGMDNLFSSPLMWTSAKHVISYFIS